jgi:hypothetical protein
MKKIFFPFLVMPLIALCFSMSIHAQSSERDLDQVELMKQFVGFWKHDAGKDSVIIIWIQLIMVSLFQTMNFIGMSLILLIQKKY